MAKSANYPLRLSQSVMRVARAGRADWRRVQAILDRVGTEPPCEGDELPAHP